MQLIFEKGAPGRHLSLLPGCDVPEVTLSHPRKAELELPEVSETEVTRHYTALAKQVHGGQRRVLPPGFLHHEVQPQDQRGHGRPA